MSRGPSRRQAALILLILLVGGAAFAFGSVELWARETLRFGGLLTLGVILWTTSPREVFGGTAGRLALPVALIVLWGFVQTIPLPRTVLSLVSPTTAAVFQDTVPAGGGESLPGWLLEKAADEGVSVDSSAPPPAGPADSGGVAVGRSLSVYPRATRLACLSWITCLLFFFVATYVARSAFSRSRLFWAISGWTGLLGAVAIVQQIAWNGKILWLRPRPSGTGPLGPYVSPTHFAGFVELGTLLALGLALALLSRTTGKLDLAGIRAAILDRAWALPRLIGAVFLTILGVSGLLLSKSAGGLFAFGAALVALILAKRLRWALPVLAATVVILGVAVSLVSTLGPGAQDLESVPLVSSEQSPSLALRVDAWGKTLRLFLDSPAAGTGLGTFPWTFPRYQRQGEWLSWGEAHNDYLQFLSEAGLVGVLLLAWALYVFVRRVLRPAVGRMSGQPRWTTLATAAAVLAMLLHSIVDFNLQIPANAVLFSVLVGILTAAADDGPPGEATR